MSILILFILFALAACAPNLPTEDASEHPLNIIIVMTDDQGYGDINIHGNPLIKTPNLNKLYTESVRFTDFHVATSCAPTRAGILSGIHCNRAGAWHTVNGRSFLASRYQTLAEVARQQGYQSGIFGKWHLGDNYPFRPQDQGFDDVLIHGGGGVGQTPDNWNNDQFNDRYFQNGKRTKFHDYCTDVWFDAALDFIEAKSENEQPFFCYLTPNAPHSPHFAPEKFLEMYQDVAEVPNAGFYAQITQFDERMGDLDQKLTELGIADNTILIFLTDNGTSAGIVPDGKGYPKKGYNAGMRGRKVSEYEGGHRVPLFIRFPRSMKIPKTEHNDLVTYTDLLPTLSDLLGWNFNPDYTLDGQSIAELIRTGEQKELKDRILIVDTQRNDRPVKWKNTSIMQDKWRLVNKRELYNISTDPGQRENLIGQKPELVSRLNTYYDQWWAQLEKDIAEDLRIVVGHPAEKPSLLTCHDWHLDQDPPWHQGHIRAGLERNGYWLLNVDRAGDYAINLYRWPPSLSLSMRESVEEGHKVPGGTPYPPGIGINVTEARLAINGKKYRQRVDDNAIFANFEIALEQGPLEFQTWLKDEQGVERGAYYVLLERLE